MALTILVADDDLGIRTVVNDYLEMLGYWVVVACDGQEAFHSVQTYHPHLLITDIMMPKMDGYQLVKQMRQLPVYRLLPVIMLTERANTQERIKGYQLGCDFYLAKPFEMSELGAMVRNLLERSQMIQSEWSQRMQSNSTSSSVKEEEVKVVDLSNREKEVLDMIAQGMSNTEIGNTLHLSPRTIEKYVSSIFKKTLTNNRAELVRFAMENHLLTDNS